MTIELTATEKFFYDHAGVSYHPDRETYEQGRIRGAKELRRAENKLRSGPFFVTIEPDDVPWDGDEPYDGPLWVVTLFSTDMSTTPRVVGSIGSVACDEGDPYLRVVAAELAFEYLT
jgi:hypothetical protein